jgi:hypothetical protein
MHAHEMNAYEMHAYKVHAREMHVYEVHTHEVHACEVHAHEVFTSLPCAQDTGGEHPCINTNCFKASDCGRLGRQVAGHPWSALRVVKSCRKDCPTAEVLLEAKAAALHPERYQSLLSKLSTKEGG